MMRFLSFQRKVIPALAGAFLIVSLVHAETADGLRKRLGEAAASIKDLKGTMVITSADRSNAGEINKGVLEFLDQGFKEASVAYKRPDRFMAQGKARGIDLTYVLNGDRKQILAPALMLKKTDNLSDDRAKKQSTLDIGFASDSLWRDNNVKLINQSKGLIQLQLVPKGANDKRKELIWVESRSLKLVKRERYKGDGKLKARYVYSGHKAMGKIPVATVVKAYAADGGYAGSITYKDLKVNTGVSDSLFKIK